MGWISEGWHLWQGKSIAASGNGRYTRDFPGIESESNKEFRLAATRLRFFMGLVAATAFSLCSGSLVGATVERVLADKYIAILKLAADERSSFAVGDEITLQNGGEKIDGQIQGVSGSKAKVYILFGVDDLAEGQTLRLTDAKLGRSMEKGDQESEGRVQTTFRDDFDIPFVFVSGLDPDLASSRWTTGFGSVSGLLNYATKYDRGKENATPFNLARYGVSTGARYEVDSQSDVGLLIDFEKGEDNGKDADGGTDLEHSGLMAQISYARYY